MHLLDKSNTKSYTTLGKHTKKLTNPVLKGGKYLGSGSFGCVITPALQCNRKTRRFSQSQKRYSIPRDDVSKIISRTDIDLEDTIENEIAISSRLKQIDPFQKYFLYIKEHCKIRDVPNTRSNIASVRFLDDESIELEMLDKKKLDKNHCDVDLKLNPRNLILSNGGKDLGEVLHIYSKVQTTSSAKRKTEYKLKYDNEIEMTNLFYKNFRYHARALLEGLYKLHQNNIVQRDIKIENLMMDWSSKAKTAVIVRYIDFGLSEILTRDYISSKSNLHAQGTPELIPPDIIIASELKKYYKYGKEYVSNKVFRELDKSVWKTFAELHLDSSIIKPKVRALVDYMYKLIIDGNILDKYFGTGADKFNGYVHKSDIYALGITFYEILHKYCHRNPYCADLKKNPKLAHLLKNMIELDPEKRYNVLQCLQHPYFQ